MFKLFRKRREKAVEVIEKEACIHHWMFEPPRGHKSIGVCKFCGNTVEQVNYVDSYNRPHNLAKRGKARDKRKAP